MPHLKGSVPQDCLPSTHISDTNRKATLSPVLLINWLQVGGSHDHFRGFDEGAGEARKAPRNIHLHLPAYYQVYSEGHWWTARRKGCVGQGVWEGPWGLHCLSVPFSQHFMCWLAQKLSEPCLLRFLWRLHYTGMIGLITGLRWLTQFLVFLFSLGVRRWGWKFQPSNQLVPLASSLPS